MLFTFSLLFLFTFSLESKIPLPKDLFYLNELPLAQKRAEKLDQPLAFIVALPEFLDEKDENTDPVSPHPAGATHFAFQSFQEKAVLIWINADSDQKTFPPLVESTLYDSGMRFFYPPQIIITTPSLDRVIAKVVMTTSIEERQQASLKALEAIEQRHLWKSPLSTPETSSPDSPLRFTTSTSSGVLLFLGILLGMILTFFYLKITSTRS